MKLLFYLSILFIFFISAIQTKQCFFEQTIDAVKLTLKSGVKSCRQVFSERTCYRASRLIALVKSELNLKDTINDEEEDNLGQNRVCVDFSIVAGTGCKKFIRCANGIPFTFSCSGELVFDVKIRNCNFKSMVTCSDQIQPPTIDTTDTPFIDPPITKPSVIEPPEDGFKTGEGTFYVEWKSGLGSCGSIPTNAFRVAALSSKYMKLPPGITDPNKHPLCASKDNSCILVKGQRGAIVLKVSDTCGGCGSDDIDIADTAFSFIDDPNKGRVRVQWKFVQCSKFPLGPFKG